MNRVYLKTYGCQMNERGSEAVAAMLRNRGYSIIDSEHNADTGLLTESTVTALLGALVLRGVGV